MRRVGLVAAAMWLGAMACAAQAPAGPPPQRASSQGTPGPPPQRASSPGTPGPPPQRASSQGIPGPAAEVQGSYNRLKPNVIKAAEKMPDADFQYKPTPDIRTFARIVNHITEAQQHTCSALNGTAFDPKTVPSDTADKATIVAGLKASFDVCDKAYGALTNENIAEMVNAGRAQRSRIGMAWGNVSHDNEQYAELSTYLRLKGIVPPTAEK